MKILCLHGVGSSGAILERQMANLRRSLDPSFELYFIDGPFECERGPGVPEHQPGPFFSHTQGYSPAEMTEAVDYLEDVLYAEGPFDGIFGFSQGAALTLSYLYQQQAAGEPLPVKFTCLFSTAMVCSSDVDVGEGMIAKLRALDFDITDRDGIDNGDLSDDEQEFVSALHDTAVDAAAQLLLPLVDLNVYRTGNHKEIPRVMHPLLLKEKLQIPTVHVWGRNDVACMIKMAELARGICEESRLKTVLHPGRHDIPKGRSEIQSVIRHIDWATAQV